VVRSVISYKRVSSPKEPEEPELIDEGSIESEVVRAGSVISNKRVSSPKELEEPELMDEGSME